MLLASIDVVTVCPFLRFFVEVSRSRDQRLVTINCSSKISSEVWFVDSKTPLSFPTLIQSRQPGLLYHVEHSDNYLFILANTGANQEYQVRVSVSDLSNIVQNKIITVFMCVIFFSDLKAAHGTFSLANYATLGATVQCCSWNSH